MKSRILFSPYMAYCISFLLVIPIYLLDWSYLFPPITSTLLFFFLVTFCVALVGAVFFKDLLPLTYKRQTLAVKDLYVILLILFHLADFAYSRTIPLFALINNISFITVADTYGIPVMHVFIVGYTAFISTVFFHSYLSQKKTKYLLYYILALVFALLIISRITLTFIFVSSIYVYLMSIRKNLAGKLVKIGVIATLFLGGFGLIGNLRTTNEVDAGNLILVLGEAKPRFANSGIPAPYFWGYLYIASPLANLQLNIDRRDVTFTIDKLVQLIIHEFLWDSISNRIDAKYDYKRAEITQINGSLNVGSVFVKPYVYLGLWGMYIMYGFMFLITTLYMFTLNRQSKYFITYIACFNTIIVLCIFDNLLAFTPLSIILVFPLIEKIKHFFIKSKMIDERNDHYTLSHI